MHSNCTKYKYHFKKLCAFDTYMYQFYTQNTEGPFNPYAVNSVFIHVKGKALHECLHSSTFIIINPTVLIGAHHGITASLWIYFCTLPLLFWSLLHRLLVSLSFDTNSAVERILGWYIWAHCVGWFGLAMVITLRICPFYHNLIKAKTCTAATFR